MTTLYDDGIRKVLEGITTLEEVFRVAKTASNVADSRLSRRARHVR